MKTLGQLVAVDAAICAALAVLTYVVVVPFAKIDIDPQHDGLMFKVAFDIYHGAIPFRDSFSQYGLLISLIQAAILKLFGPTLLMLRLFTVFVYALTAPLMWLLCRLVLSRLMSAVAVVLWFAVAPFYLYPLLPWCSSAVLPIQAVMIILASKYFADGNRWYLGVSAACAAAIFWIRMPIGIVSLLSFFCVIAFLHLSRRWRVLDVLESWRDIVIVLAAFFAFSVPFLIYLTVTGAFHDWFLQTFVMAIVFARSIPEVWGTGSGVVGILTDSFFPFWLNALWGLMPAIALVGFVLLMCEFLRSWPRASEGRLRTLLVLTTFAVASWSQYYPVTEERHVFWASMPLVPLALYWVNSGLSSIGERLPKRTRFGSSVSSALTVLLALGVVTVPVVQRYEAATARLDKFTHLIQHPSVLKGMYGTLDQVHLYAAMDRDIRQLEKSYPDSSLITTGFDALYLTFGKYHPNWHPLYVFYDIGVAIYPEYPHKLEEFIEKHRPIILSPGDVWRANGYSKFAMYSNGLNLLQPSPASRPFLLPSPKGTVLIDDTVPNFADLLAPMRQTGLRLPSFEWGRESTLEFVFQPVEQEREGEVLMATMFGPHPQQGFAIMPELDARTYGFYIANRNAKALETKPVLQFSAIPGRCNYVVIRRRGNYLDVWRDGVPMDQGRIGNQPLNSRNQFIVNTGILLRQRYHGFVRQVRVVDRALSDEEILKNSVFALRRCRSSLQE